MEDYSFISLYNALKTVRAFALEALTPEQFDSYQNTEDVLLQSFGKKPLENPNITVADFLNRLSKQEQERLQRIAGRSNDTPPGSAN